HTWAIFNSHTTVINRRIAGRDAFDIDITVQIKLDAIAFGGGLDIITAFEPHNTTITDWFNDYSTAIDSKVKTSIDIVLVGFDVGGIGADICSIRCDIGRVFGDVAGIGCNIGRIGLNTFSHYRLAALDRSYRTIDTSLASTSNIAIGKG